MKKSTKIIVRLLSLVLLCVCFWGKHANAKGWEDENILRQETVYGMNENGELFEIDDEEGFVYDGVEGVKPQGRSNSVKVVNFKTKSITQNTNYTEYETNATGYTNGSYGADAAYIGEEKGKVIFMMAGVKGKVDPSDVEIVDYADAKSVSYYTVSNGNLIHRITYNMTKTTYSSLNNGKAPSYLKEGVKYYSYDGHYFYKKYATMIVDYQKNTRVNSVNPKQPYYNYYQFLPFRSRIEYTADEIYSIYNKKLDGLGYLSTSKLKNQGRVFVQYQNQYGINALLMMSIASNESNWGTSSICMNKNNIFGWDAVDASPGESADSFTSISKCIKEFSETYMSKKYLRPGYTYYNGAYLGNKASGINVRYASDPYWGEKAAAIAYGLDTLGGNKDAGTYTIGIKDGFRENIKERSDLKIREGSSTSKTILYKTGLVKDYAVLIRKEEKENDFYQIQSDAVLQGDRSAIDSSVGKYNFKNMYVYAHSSYIDVVNKGEDLELMSLATPKNVSAQYEDGKITFKWEKVNNAQGYYVYRKVGSGNYTRIKEIASGDTLSYTDNNVEMGKTYTYTARAYNKSVWSLYYSAGVSVKVEQEEPEEPEEPEKITYTKYRVTGDGVNYRSGAGTGYAKKGSLDKGTVINVENGYSKKANGYTWVRFKLNSKNYYIVKKYLEKVITLSKPELVSAKYSSSVVTVKWNKVSKAKGYYVYRKLSGGTYKKIATVKSGTTLTYKDKNIVKGKTYVYTVKAYNGNNVSKYNTTGIKVTTKTYTKYKTTTGVKYRSGAGTGFASKGTLPEGTVIRVENGYSKVADGYTWVRFKLNSKNYYIVKKYLKKV